tara:strand:+ start:688 stop:861 length:174 start_codon:yes stop_codon:yes gene_type:complete
MDDNIKNIEETIKSLEELKNKLLFIKVMADLKIGKSVGFDSADEALKVMRAGLSSLE